MFNSKALTKIQSAVLIAVIVFASVGGGVAYVLLSGQEQLGETIKIGVCADLDSGGGKGIWQEAILATEQVNAEGGVLGRNFEIVAEDDDGESATVDIATATNAFTKLITVDEADYVIYSGRGGLSLAFQDIAADHKIILFDAYDSADELTQRVLDDYEKYKYFFRVGIANTTSNINGFPESFRVLREYTGFNKVAFVSNQMPGQKDTNAAIIDILLEYGFEVVYNARVPLDTVEFSSYFAGAETSGAEILCSFIITPAGVSFVKEYYDRQSPMVLWGFISMAGQSNFWELTEGKCEHITSTAYPTAIGYPLTNKTLLFTDAYMERWGEVGSGAVYDLVRYILPDALKRAGTTETEAVIKALETTSIETSLARRFVFTSSHDIMVGSNRPGEEYFLTCFFQWQNGEQVPVLPKEIMEEAGVTYTYPDWAGPWD